MSQSHTDSAPRYLIAGLADSPTRTGAEDDIVWVVQKHDADNSGTNLNNPRKIRETIRGTNRGRIEDDLERLEDDLGRFENDLGRFEDDLGRLEDD